MTAPSLKYLLAAEGYLELGMLEEASESLDQIPIDDIAHPDVVRLRVELYTMTRQWSMAIAASRQMVITHPEDPQWWISLAYATRRAENVKKAEKILLDAASFHPDEPLIRYNLACYSSVQGRLEEARQRLEQAFILAPKLREFAETDEDLSPLRSIPG